MSEWMHQARAEAWRRYPEGWDPYNEEPVDDWGYSECQREAFVAGVDWADAREALLSDETVERAARGIHASHDRGWHFDAEDHAVQDEYRDMARVALAAALGEDESNE